jgi:hypothetical protein
LNHPIDKQCLSDVLYQSSQGFKRLPSVSR